MTGETDKFVFLSRQLRKNATEAEKIVWRCLRNRQLQYKFIRQFNVDDKYIVDFVCLEKRLIIELDGGQHSDCAEDRLRDAYLQDKGYKVLRFWNNDVLNNLEGCLQVICDNLEA